MRALLVAAALFSSFEIEMLQRGVRERVSLLFSSHNPLSHGDCPSSLVDGLLGLSMTIESDSLVGALRLWDA